MLEQIDKKTLEGLLPSSDCEKNLGVKWLTGTPTGSFYIGDKDSKKQSIKNFIDGKKKCFIDSKSYFKYLNDVEEILKKFKHMFYGPIDVLEKSKQHFQALPENERYIYISYTYPDRYLKTSKFDKNVSEFKFSLAANITKIRFQKNINNEYFVYVYLVKNWRELIMGKASKCNIESIVTIFNDFMNDNMREGKTIVDAARLFGIKYCSLISNNSINIDEVLQKSKFANNNLSNYVKNGMLLSKDIIWESKNDDEQASNYNVYGIHITLENSALNDENPHICIGWSGLGDLSNINSKDELKNHYLKLYPNVNKYALGQNISQIWLFKNEAQIGDYIVYFDKTVAHIGKIVGEYEYLKEVENQDKDYVNNRKVEWIKDILYKDLPEDYRNSAKTQKSFFKLSSYRSLIEDIINNKVIESSDDTNSDEGIPFDFDSSTIKNGNNLIVYGTPGCGKSYYVEHVLLNGYPKENYIRTTFFADYTNTDFVGQILPFVEGEKVTYKFNPGPFTLALAQAIRKPNERVALVIEELNRGSAASIFGDIFQLLDRKEGISEYPIKNMNLINYLNDEFSGVYKFEKIRIPSNLFIYATMNTSDQNVFTLDTAFKRRWEFKKLKNEFRNDPEFQRLYIPSLLPLDVTWEQLVNAINEYMLELTDNLNNEDKQIGVYFVDKTGMRNDNATISSQDDTEKFAYKVLEYLWDDVSKFSREKWFQEDIKSLDQLVERYLKNGIEVFSDELKGKFNS